MWLLLLVVSLIFVLGNFQYFVDSTQSMLLETLVNVSVILILTGVVFLVEYIVMRRFHRRLKIFRIVVISIIIIAALSIMLFAEFIHAWTQTQT